MHIPVLVEALLSFFHDRPLHCFVDGTAGAGGHAEALLHAHPELECYLAIDQDPTALAALCARLHSPALQVCRGNFGDLSQLLENQRVRSVDGILLDIGVSSMQLDTAERGFSFSKEGPLDMRMDPDQEVSAEQLVQRLSERELGEIFRLYGEEPRWRQAARALVEGRKRRKIATTQELCAVLAPVLRRQGKLHPMTRIFQALRIAVNDELGVLERGLAQAIEALRPGGRLAVITFHSLEDRIVKQLFRASSELLILTKKPIPPTREEVRRNPRCRSAKLRVAEKV